jgi:hypothetical protein
MPGSGRIRWEPTKPLPWPCFALFFLVFVDFWIDWLMGITINRWAHQFPTANHWYEYHMKGGRTYYLFPSVGWYLDNNMWIYFGALVLIFLLSLVYGVRWKRVR